MTENKSVIEYLQDIDKKLNNSKSSKMIADPFTIEEPLAQYINSSTIYYYEPDERKFEKHRKKQIKKLFISLLLTLIPLILHIILSIIYKELFIINYIADIFFASPSLFYLIYAFKQKNKKLADSKWNIKNHKFYIYENKLGEEDSKGLVWKFVTLFKLIVYLLFLISSLTVILGTYDELFKFIFLLFHYIVSIACVSLYLISYREYYYTAYIFDNKDSYIFVQYGVWKKIMK